MVKVTERFSIPTKLDFAEYGSICKAISDHGSDIYIQTSKDEERPSWKSLGLFLEISLGEYITTPKFLEECLHLYDRKERSSLSKILDVMTHKN